MQDYYVTQIRALIEQSLGWEDPASWTTQDFEELSLQIQEKTGHMISATTLKRIWGRVAYDSKPSRHSLDALARFMAYRSWRAFMQSVDVPAEAASSGHPVESAPPTSTYRPSLIFGLFMLAVGAGIVLWLGLRSAPGGVQIQQDTENKSFSSRPLAQGLPNTVVFDYDLSGVKADSFFIQQSWDVNRRVRISPDKRNHAAIYYYPGYFDAKLVANNTILKEIPIHVKTQGWTAIVRKDSFPVYVPAGALAEESALMVDQSWLKSEGFELEDPYELGYYNVRNFGPLSVDDFSMEVSVKLVDMFAAPCSGGQVLVRGRYGIIRFPFNIPGCVGMMHVTASDVFQQSADHDMSALGADYSNWQPVRLEVRDRNARIQIGTNPPYELSYANNLGELVGIWFQFAGLGAIDTIKLSDGYGQIIYEDLF